MKTSRYAPGNACGGGEAGEKNLDSWRANTIRETGFYRDDTSEPCNARDGCTQAIGVMRRNPLAGLAAALCLVLVAAVPAGAFSLATTIDLDYTYSQENLAEDVRAQTGYNQKYEIKLETSLTTAYDFNGAVRLDLQDTWYTDQAATSRVSPTLELQAKGSEAAAKIAYEGVVTATDAFREEAEATTYSSAFTADLEMTPLFWPELKLKYQRKRDYQAWATDTTTTSFEATVRKDIASVRLEYGMKLDDVDKVVPDRMSSDGIQWSGKATYKEILWGGTEFELAYEVKELYKQELVQDVFSSDSEEYTQQVKTRLKNSLELTPLLVVGAAWEYQFDQDLMLLTYDYKVKNQYLLDMRWDPMWWLKVSAEAKRDTELTAAVPGEEDVRSATDTVKAGFDLSLIQWLRLAGKAELRNEGKIAVGSGSSVDRIEEDKYELIAKNKFGDFWDLTANATSSNKRTDGWLSNRETKVKADLKLKLLELIVTPSYEAVHTAEWEWGFDDPSDQKQTRDARIKVEYKLKLVDLLSATFSHEYGLKLEHTLDEVLNFERTLQLTEDTRLNIAITELVQALRLEGEIARKGTDTEADEDPQLVEVSYALKLELKLDTLSLTSSLKYNDKGDTFDDLSFNTKVALKVERLEVSGEYQYDKVYSELTDEKRKLNLRLNYKF